MTQLKKRTYGWIPDRPDQRDYYYQTIKPVIKLPTDVDLREFCSSVEDQGQLGSCTAQALAGNLEYLDNRVDAVYVDVSRLFIYYNERLIEGNTGYDAGASLRDGIKSLKNYGACEEALWPYNIKRFAQPPPSRCYEAAKARQIQSYHRIETLREMLTCLAEGFPFVFGFTVYESFETKQTAVTGIVKMPQKTEKALGGHAVMAVGYHQKKEHFLVRNSWGETWGQAGYCLMPFAYLETLAGDFWTIRK